MSERGTTPLAFWPHSLGVMPLDAAAGALGQVTGRARVANVGGL